MTPTLDATDLFAGGGGSSEGLHQAGWHVAIAANHDPIAVRTHSLNHPDTEHRIKDLSEVDWRTFPTTTMLWASPSCVWHARSGGRTRRPDVATERLRADPGAIDRATAFAVIEAAEVHRYRAIVVENVAEFAAWALYPWWLDGLRALGYQVRSMILDAADFGHAQLRKRLFIVATRDLDVDLTLPTPTFVPAAAILDPDPGREVTRKLYVAPQIEEIQVEGIPHLVTYRKHAHARRADEHRLATVTAGGNHHAVASIHGGVAYHRLVSHRECARGQGFPDAYQFVGDSKQVKRQIGNAVPVGVARWFGSRVAEALAA